MIDDLPVAQSKGKSKTKTKTKGKHDKTKPIYKAVACGAAGSLCQGRSSLCPSTPRPGPEYALRVVADATAPGGIRGAPPTIRPKVLVDDDACPKRVAPAEQWRACGCAG